MNLLTSGLKMQQNRIIGIIGPIGSGKTEHAAAIYRTLSRAVVFNAAGDQTYRTHSTVLLEDDIGGLKKELYEDEFRICFDTMELEPGPRGTVRYTHFEPFLFECFWTGSLTLVLDEAHQLCNPWSAPFELLKTVRRGRHQNLDIIFASQRFASVHRELTYNAHELHMFRITEPGDLEGIEERCGEDVRERVSNLRRIVKRPPGEGGYILPGECLIWRAEDGSFTVV